MLRSIDPLLNGMPLSILDDSDHSSDIVIAAANFPAIDVARRHVELTGGPADRVLEALLSVLPFDDLVEAPSALMVARSEAEPMYTDFGRFIEATEGLSVKVERVDPDALMARARAEDSEISSGDRRPYDNLILRKGALRHESGAA
ncbi:ribose ABC transporter [Lichenibacterium minor]|uniref:Ribose ABC transporter n=1 Tax=Lichenibacterium minor TaxID=2316528 RepID=A0A4Q2UAN7_9HYPH|nr:RbsD/FucU domain-containing protein [Lichenibacterium minor]RYC33632.1 ribose ABC transporter [Lichenibacterium minor]